MTKGQALYDTYLKVFGKTTGIGGTLVHRDWTDLDDDERVKWNDVATRFTARRKHGFRPRGLDTSLRKSRNA